MSIPFGNTAPRAGRPGHAAAASPSACWLRARPAGNPAACAAIADNTERLACYDGASAGRTRRPAPGRRGAAAGGALGPLRRWELDAGDKRGTFLITPYKPTYMLVGRWSNSAQSPAHVAQPGRPGERPCRRQRRRGQVPDQLQDKLWEGLVGPPPAICGWATPSCPTGRPTKSFSAPFRETNYEPELMAVFRTNLDAGLGFKVKMLSVGLNRQSNGRGQPLSRSWNRLMVQGGMRGAILRCCCAAGSASRRRPARTTTRTSAAASGYGDLQATWHLNAHELSLNLRPGFYSRGSAQLDWTSPHPPQP